MKREDQVALRQIGDRKENKQHKQSPDAVMVAHRSARLLCYLRCSYFNIEKVFAG